MHTGSSFEEHNIRQISRVGVVVAVEVAVDVIVVVGVVTSSHVSVNRLP